MKTLILAMGVLAWSVSGEISAPQPSSTPTPLMLELKLSRAQGSPVSYKLSLLADSEGVTELRIGREVPVPVTRLSPPSGEAGPRAPIPMTSFQYRNVGMNVTGSVKTEGNRYRVHLNLERSALYEGTESDRPQPADHPSFQTFNIGGEFLLGDGERTILVDGSDPSVGDLWTVEVTLRVQK